MLSACDPPPPPPLPPPLPLHPTIPAATQASRTRPAAAYRRRALTGRRCAVRYAANNNTNTKVTIKPGVARIRGQLRTSGRPSGSSSDSVVVKVAVHDAAAELEAVGTQFAVEPKLLDPFLNCTVPVGPAPLLFVEIVAV